MAVLAAAVGSASAARAAVVYVPTYNGSMSVVAPFAAGAGTLSPITCPTCATTDVAQAAVITPNGKYLYVTEPMLGQVAAFAISAAGTLSPITCDTVAMSQSCPIGQTGSNASSIAVTPDGRFLYATDPLLPSSIAAFSIGADGSLSAVNCPACQLPSDQPQQPAITPNGQFLYVPSFSAADVLEYSVNSDGSLSALCGGSGQPACPATGAGPIADAITPDGRYLYVSDFGSHALSVFAIGGDGSLSATCGGGGGQPNCPGTGSGPDGVTISPSGAALYVANYANGSTSTGSISPFSINPDGTLAASSCSPSTSCSGLSGPQGAGITPNGAWLYLDNSSSAAGMLSAFSVSPGASLAPVSACSGCSTGSGSAPQRPVVTPDQSPTASFTATAAAAGAPSSFNASGSSASPGQTVVRYDWDFGDGVQQTSASATATHTYATAGTYTVTLTVTDDAGCSSSVVFTGQMVSCNGSGQLAISTAQITVPPAPAPPRPAKPACTLTPVSSHVTLLRAGQGRRHPRAARGELVVRASCDQPAAARLSVTVVAGRHPAAGKGAAGPRRHARRRQIALRPVQAVLLAGQPVTIAVRLPRGVLAALRAGVSESVTFTLRASNANGLGIATASISRLRL